MNEPKPITVLLVDDSAFVRQSFCQLLEAEGDFKVAGKARNGREAVTMAKELRPDVVVMDLAMPILNGIDATEEIMAEDPSARVLILSAYETEEYRKRMASVGIAGFLSKASAATTLAEKIRRIFRSSGRGSETAKG